MKKIKRLSFVAVLSAFGILLMLKPQIPKENIVNSILICGNVIIPSLFPFCVCVLCLMKSGVLNFAKTISPLTFKILRVSGYSFFIFIFSMLGGYPIGAKLISTAVKEGTLSQRQGAKMLNYCINAGPGFIISAVGGSVLKSRQSGLILFVSHIAASLLICFFSNFKSSSKEEVKVPSGQLSIADNFTLSTAESATALLGICGYIILFSSVTAYLECSASLKPLVYLCEITLGIYKTRNIYLISFLLGFAGFCVWCQIFSISKEIKINYPIFILCRLAHGLISCLLTYALLKFFPVSVPTFSNINPTLLQKNSMGSVGIAIIVMGIIFVISLANPKPKEKILEEFI